MSEQNLTRRQQAEQYLKNANVRRYLDLIAYAEGVKHGYNTTFGNGRIDDLSHHPNKTWGKTKDGATSATGRYQFLKGTWADQQKQLGLEDFGPHSQDLAAVSLMMSRGAMDDIMNGNIDVANRKLSPIWASLPYHGSPNQLHRTSEELNRVWKNLQSSGGLSSMGEQSYDYSTTIPNINTTQNTPISNTAATQITNTLANFGNNQNTNTPNTDNSFQQYFTDLNKMTPTLTALEPTQSQSKNRHQYQNELAQAFGIAPSANDGLPDYVGDLVKSIYDYS